MSTSTHTHFIVFGAGGIGSFIVEGLLKLKEAGTISTVRVGSRSNAIKESNPEWFSRGGELAVVDYSDESSILAATQGIEVVITALGFTVLEKQKDLIKAAKAAGAKLFVLTDYGRPLDRIESGFWSTKLHLINWFKEFGFPFMRILCGLWPEFFFNPLQVGWIGWDVANGKATINGVGDSKISWTTSEDTARFLIYILTHFASSELSGKTFNIEGDNLTFNEVIEAYEKKVGKKIQVTHITREALTEKAARGDIISEFLHEMDVNGGEVTRPLDNDLFPGWNPKKVLDVIV